jgi:acetylornithine/N-succinyldiaminopimelate aminotransferase
MENALAHKLGDSSPVMNTYGRYPVTFVRGQGAKLWDTSGKEYIDLLAGVAVVSSGHANEDVARAIAAHAHTLVHVSNFFWNEPMMSLASKLDDLAPWPSKIFFCNSGAEAIECALKLSRRWGGQDRTTVVAALKGFHGRTYGALAATGQPSKWEGFAPLPGGFIHAEFNNLRSFEKVISSKTCAVILEVIQGEGGVIPANHDFICGVSELCKVHGALLILDEIQCGVGRTGTWWGFEQYGVVPDIFTSAKGLANGLPIGACIARSDIAEALGPGTHGSTFGGGPLVCAAALANLRYIADNDLLTKATITGAYLAEQLTRLPKVKIVRGIGLMQAAVLKAPIAKKVANEALQKGVIVNAVNDDTLRFVPPLVITLADIDAAIRVLYAILSKEVVE